VSYSSLIVLKFPWNPNKRTTRQWTIFKPYGKGEVLAHRVCIKQVASVN